MGGGEGGGRGEGEEVAVRSSAGANVPTGGITHHSPFIFHPFSALSFLLLPTPLLPAGKSLCVHNTTKPPARSLTMVNAKFPYQQTDGNSLLNDGYRVRMLDVLLLI